MSSNRMLVENSESHITEQDRLEKKIADGDLSLMRHMEALNAELFNSDWEAAAVTARTISVCVEYMAMLERRLEDVVDINAQFARIQEQVDRIEKLIKEQDGVIHHHSCYCNQCRKREKEIENG